MVIWKFQLSMLVDLQKVMMPEGAELLSVANKNGNLFLWAMVDPSKENQCRWIEIIGTGTPITMNIVGRKFIGTAVVNPFVWHVFERLQPSI